MKRAAALILSLVLALMCLAGCGNGKTAESSATPVDSNAAGSTAPETPPDGVDWSSKTPVTIRIGHTNSETDSRHTMLLEFADLMKERTNGVVEIEVYGGGVLGTAREMVEGLQAGMLEVVVEGYNCMSYFSDYAKDTLPFLYDSYDHFMKCWYDSEVGDKWIGFAEDVGFTVFAPSYRGFRIVTSTKPFTTAEEVKGLRIRTPSTSPFLETWQALETQAIPMSLSEVLAGLQQGTIEAQENPVGLSYNYGFYDACKYVIKTNHVCGADIFMIDTNYWNTLDPDVQEVFKETAIECSKEVSQYNMENEEHMFELFEEKGCTVIDADVQSFRDKLDSFVDDNFPEMREICDMIAEVEY